MRTAYKSHVHRHVAGTLDGSIMTAGTLDGSVTTTGTLDGSTKVAGTLDGSKTKAIEFRSSVTY